MSQFDRQKWLQQSLDLLSCHGPEVLRVDALCRHLGVTKGSFYHHFANRDAFVDALLAHWQQAHTQDLIEAAQKFSDPQQRSRALTALVNAQNKQQELAMRGWALRDTSVAAFVAEVDQQRMQCIADIVAGMMGSEARANLFAKLIYSQWLGSIQLSEHISATTQAEIETLLLELLQAGTGPAESR